MRLLLLTTALLAGASPALAEPAEPCHVDYVRGPPEVVATIEAWVRAEPRCATPLELRVIPTADGLYLLGRRPDGRLHERLVPDAQTAGVLVASWVAQDQPVAVHAPTTVGPAPLIVDPFAGAEVPRATTLTAAAPAPRPTDVPVARWASLAYMLGMNNGGTSGGRLDLDLVVRGPWTLGAVGSISASASPAVTANGDGYLHARDRKLLAHAARTSSFGRWLLRFGGGLGVVHSEVDFMVFSGLPENLSGQGLFPTAEVSVTLSRQLGDRWAISAGPAATWISQYFDKTDPTGTSAARTGVQVVLLGGLRVRL